MTASLRVRLKLQRASPYAACMLATINAQRAPRYMVLAATLSVVGAACAPAMPRPTEPPTVSWPIADSRAQAPLPTFDHELLLEATAETSANASIGDVNGDGKPDIMLAKGRHWPLVDRVLLGDGKGGFAPATDLGTASDRSYAARLVDLDRDGDLDVVLSNDRPDPSLVYLNDGKGHFTIGSTFGKAEWPTRNASVADVNGDGLPDIIVANRYGNNPGGNYVCLNRGAGRFDDQCLRFSQESATTITPADVNQDGLVDLIVPHRDGGQSMVYMQQPRAGSEPTFKGVPFGPADAAIRASESGDFNGDGLLDLVAIDEANGLSLYARTRAGGFAAGVSLGRGATAPYAMAVGDMNADGLTDIVVGYVQAPSVVYFNQRSSGTFVPVSFGDGKGTVYGFAIGDVDIDGQMDIAAGRSEAPNVLYFGNKGASASPPGSAPRR